MLKGLRDFILRGNVVDLAVAVVVGAAFTQIINSFVADMLTPLLAAIGGQPDFSALTFEINNSQFRYGVFINAIISFLIVAVVIYFLVVLPMNKLLERRKKGEVPPPEPTEDILILRQIRDLLRDGGSPTTVDRPTPTPPDRGA
jgi:large conductance mechanosensitive channel